MESYNQQNEQEIIAKVLKDGKSRITVVPSSRSLIGFLRSKYISIKYFMNQSKTKSILIFIMNRTSR